MPSQSFKFGTYTFKAQSWSESAPQRIESVVVPRRDGTLASDGRPQAKRITIRGILSGATPSDLRAAEEAMLAAFRAPSATSPVGQLRAWDDRYINAQLDTWDTDYLGKRLTAKSWQAAFLAASPYWLSDNLNTQTKTPNADPYTFTLTGAGTANALPLITLTATNTIAAGLKLVNATANAYLQYNAGMSSGDVLVVDCEALTAVDNGVNVLTDVAGDFWPILPGVNTISAHGVNGTATIKFDWRDRWH